MTNSKKTYTDHLEAISVKDVTVLRRKDKEYGGSWLKRGGIGAFMMLARKWDRLETAMTKEMRTTSIGHFKSPKSSTLVEVTGNDPIVDYDIIHRALADGREEGILDDIGDLRRYLLLVESEIRNRIAQCNSPSADSAAKQS